MQEDDFLLVERVLAGDRRAFESLVRKHERRVFRVALAVLGNVEDAEEAMQDAFIKAYRHLDQFRGESKFTTWLTRIAVNEALQKRQARKETVSLDEAPDVESKSLPGRFEPWTSNPEKLYGKKEMRQLVERAIQALPPIYRETLVLRDIEEMSAEEAAEALGLKVPALKSRLLRARLMLREALATSLEQPPTLSRKVMHAAQDIGMAVAMRMMKAVGK
ncbi:MAG TPA: sigma-70 family RNA polymerase sigma factor [Candidatus Acidoferrales bacterium]|nr:sigma-70 family RNA polymerase sigma factor [Candidatus Acidoferrales bacterium]